MVVITRQVVYNVEPRVQRLFYVIKHNINILVLQNKDNISHFGN